MNHYLVDLPLRVALSPLLAAQALQVRARAIRLPEAPGPRSGEVGEGPVMRLLILGDSSAAGVGAPSQEQALAGQLVARLSKSHRVIWQLEAQTGDTTKDAIARLDRMDPAQFDVAVVALGVNDVTRFVPLPVWLARQCQLLNVLRQRFGVRQVCLSGLPPMGAFPLLPQPLRWVLGRQADRLDRALRDFAASAADVDVVSMAFELDISHMAEDGFHPGPVVYAEWAETLLPMIRRS